MNIFNSLGSNYNFSFVLKALFATNKDSHKEKLVKFLEEKYQGRVILVYKGREAITLALDIILKSREVSSRGAKGDVAIPSGKRLLLRQLADRNDIPPQVAINGFTCFAVYKAVIQEDYEAEILDLDDKLDLNFSVSQLEKALKKNPKIKVVIIQNTLGYPCDIEAIQNICRKNNLVLIEDLAHCVGTKYKNGKEAGTVGDFVVLSFSQDKIIDAISGGALIIRNKKYSNKAIQQFNNVNSKQQLTDRLYPLFTFIIRKTYPIGIGKLIHLILKSLNLLSKPMNESFYAKYNLPNWYQYLVLNAFYELDKNLNHRRKVASVYAASLDRKIVSELINRNVNLSTNLRYPIFVENRKGLIKFLKKEGFYVSDIWYDSVDDSLKNAKMASNTILNLPTHINVSEKDAKSIAQKINYFILRAKSGEVGRVEKFSIDSKKEWEDFLSKHPEANFLQSWYWGEFHKNLGNDIQRTGFYQSNKLVCVMLSVVENAKRGRYLTVPGGPIIDWKNRYLIDAFVREIKKISNDKNCVFARVRPQLDSNDFSKNIFKENGFINAPMHLHAELTSQLDITKSEDELLKNMRKTTRYEIKKAISEGIKITASKDSMIIKDFYKLQIETAKRQKFVPFSYDFLYTQFKTFSENKHALLYEAWLEKTLLAQAFIIFYGQEAVYHYGASTEEGRKYPGAYLIQWEAIKEAKKRDMTRYNFWGVAPADEPKHRFYGLSLFKRGFGGKDIEYLHAQDLIINRPRYIINYTVESIRKKIRNV